MIRAISLSLLALMLVSCAATRERVAGAFNGGADAADLVTLADLAEAPGIYAGRRIAVPGEFTFLGGEACLADRGRAIAIRLTPKQYALYEALDGAPVTATGEFSQFLCPRGDLCPSLCARAGFSILEEIVTP